MGSLAAENYQKLLAQQKQQSSPAEAKYKALLAQQQSGRSKAGGGITSGSLTGLDRSKIGEADYNNLLGEVQRTGFNATATRNQTAYLGNQFMVLPAGPGIGKDGWRSTIPVDYDYVGTLRGQDLSQKSNGTGDGSRNAPDEGPIYERIVVKKQAPKAAAPAPAAPQPSASKPSAAPTKEVQQARQDAAEKAQAWRDAPSTNNYLTPTYAGAGGSLASTAQSAATGQPTGTSSAAPATGGAMDPAVGNPFTGVRYTGNTLIDDPVAFGWNQGQQSVNDYKRRFLPMVESQAMQSAKEIGAASSSAVANYKGKIPDVATPDQIFGWYQKYAGSLKSYA